MAPKMESMLQPKTTLEKLSTWQQSTQLSTCLHYAFDTILAICLFEFARCRHLSLNIQSV